MDLEVSLALLVSDFTLCIKQGMIRQSLMCMLIMSTTSADLSPVYFSLVH